MFILDMGNICCKPNKKARKKIVLLLVGLDNAGKTLTGKNLTGERPDTPLPTVGFSVINLIYLNYEIKIYDLGGGPTIRGIWHKYFVDAHGCIFVIDSSDFQRLPEVKYVLHELVSNEKISGKPLLILANKQDQEMALDDVDVIEYLQLESLANTYQCPTLVQTCSATELKNRSGKVDSNIKQGYEWILNYVIRNYQQLSERVIADVVEQLEAEKRDMDERVARIKHMKALEQKKSEEVDGIQLYDEYAANQKEVAGKTNDISDSARRLSNEVLVVNSQDVSANSSSDDSVAMTFPPVYFKNLKSAVAYVRPKSSTDVVKKQLQLATAGDGNTAAAMLLTSVANYGNKVAPITLYDFDKSAKRPSTSGNEKGSQWKSERPGYVRHLKSANDSKRKNAVFVVDGNNCDNAVNCSGDFHRDVFQLNHLPVT